jgi:opacity protein-like surface antigen
MRKIILLTIMLFCCVRLTLAQKPAGDEYPKVEIFAGFSAIGEANSNQEGADFDSNQGFQASLIRNVNKYVGIKGDFSFHFDTDRGQGLFTQPCATPPCPSITQNVTFKSRLYNFLAGPEIKARNSTRLTPFAHALFGAAHGNIRLETSGAGVSLSDSSTDTGFAMAFGGGLDLRATRRVSFRAMMDYNPTFIGETDAGRRGRLDNVRISLGILFH